MGGTCPPLQLRRFIADSVVSGLFNLGGSLFQAASSRKIADKQIAAQREANQANIEYSRWATQYNAEQQKLINQQNIDFQNKVNDLMRHDQQTQKSSMVRDLKNAGLSTAQAGGDVGFSPVQLSSPQLSAPDAVTPNIASELSPQSVGGLFGAASSITDLFSSIPKDIAKVRKDLADARGKEKENATYDELMTKTFGKLDVEMAALTARAKLDDSQRFKLEEETKNVQEQYKLLVQQVRQAKFTSDHQKEAFDSQMKQVNATVRSALASADLSEANKLLTDAKKEYQDVVNKFANIGIRFESTDYIDTIARLLFNGNFKNIAGEIKSLFSDALSELNPFSW